MLENVLAPKLANFRNPRPGIGAKTGRAVKARGPAPAGDILHPEREGPEVLEATKTAIAAPK